MVDTVSPERLTQAISNLDGWAMLENRPALYKKFVFKNFKQAFAFMTRCADLAEEMNHHPEWSNIYKTVEVTMTTHDAGGITELDLQTASAMNEYELELRAG